MSVYINICHIMQRQLTADHPSTASCSTLTTNKHQSKYNKLYLNWLRYKDFQGSHNELKSEMYFWHLHWKINKNWCNFVSANLQIFNVWSYRCLNVLLSPVIFLVKKLSLAFALLSINRFDCPLLLMPTYHQNKQNCWLVWPYNTKINIISTSTYFLDK